MNRLATTGLKGGPHSIPLYLLIIPTLESEEITLKADLKEDDYVMDGKGSHSVEHWILFW